MKIANNLREIRESRGLKKAEVAKKIGTTRSNITRWEIGTLPRIESLIQLAKLYHVSLDYLVLGSERHGTEVNRLLEVVKMICSDIKKRMESI